MGWQSGREVFEQEEFVLVILGNVFLYQFRRLVLFFYVKQKWLFLMFLDDFLELQVIEIFFVNKVILNFFVFFSGFLDFFFFVLVYFIICIRKDFI